MKHFVSITLLAILLCAYALAISTNIVTVQALQGRGDGGNSQSQGSSTSNQNAKSQTQQPNQSRTITQPPTALRGSNGKPSTDKEQGDKQNGPSNNKDGFGSNNNNHHPIDKRNQTEPHIPKGFGGPNEPKRNETKPYIPNEHNDKPRGPRFNQTEPHDNHSNEFDGSNKPNGSKVSRDCKNLIDSYCGDCKDAEDRFACFEDCLTENGDLFEAAGC